jgi:prevent-host-death family protein
MNCMNVTEAKATFSNVVERAQMGEETIVTKMGKPVAKVIPYPPTARKKRLGLFEGQITMAEDFDQWPEQEAKAIGIID